MLPKCYYKYRLCTARKGKVELKGKKPTCWDWSNLQFNFGGAPGSTHIFVTKGSIFAACPTWGNASNLEGGSG